VREPRDDEPVGERGELAAPAVGHVGDELLHRAAAAHGPDEEVRGAQAVDGGAPGRGRRARGVVQQVVLGERGRPAEPLDDAPHAAAGFGVGGRRVARRGGPDGLDLAPALDERGRARAGGGRQHGRRGAGGGGGRVGGRWRGLPERGGAGGSRAEIGLPGAARRWGRPPVEDLAPRRRRDLGGGGGGGWWLLLLVRWRRDEGVEECPGGGGGVPP
jgi:hypothetical protein